MQKCVPFSTSKVQNTLYCLALLTLKYLWFKYINYIYIDFLLLSTPSKYLSTGLSLYKNIQFIPHTEHHVNTMFSVKYYHNRQIKNFNQY